MDNKLLSTLLISITFLTLCPRITSSFSGASVRGGVNPSNHFSNRHRRSHTYSSRPPVGFNQFTSPCRSATEARASLYDDFTTSDGDVINPYDVLNIDKSATRSEVRQSYRCLCKQYHPDRVKFFETLPDKCMNQGDIRLEWERVKLANEILSDKKLRLKYDRIEAVHEALADPELAFCRMVDALGWCAMEVGKGIFALGEIVVNYVGRQIDEAEVASASELVPAFATGGARSTSIPSHTFSSNIYDANPAVSLRGRIESSLLKPSRLPHSNSPLGSSSVFFSSSSRLRWKSMSTTALGYSRSSDDSFLLEDFTTSDGEVVNPYRTLKVGRNAERYEIRQSYRTLSKKYHPDGVRFREVMPGKCNNLDDVRDEWERIKLSYEILSDKKMRMKYDRHSAIHDPLGAVGRATLNTMGWAVMETGKGIFSIGGMAVKHMANMTNNAIE